MHRAVFDPLKVRRRFLLHLLCLFFLRSNGLLLNFRWTWRLWRFFLFLFFNCLFRSLWSLRVIRSRLLVNLSRIWSPHFCALGDKPIKIEVELILALTLSRILDWTLLLPHLHQIDSNFFTVTFMLSHRFFDSFQTLWIWRCLSWIFTWRLAVYCPTRSMTWLRIDSLIHYLITRFCIL